MKVPELESRIAHASSVPLKDILKQAGIIVPQNFELRVSLLKPNSKGDLRRVRSDASVADNWSPESGCIEIRFEAVRNEPLEHKQGNSLIESTKLSREIAGPGSLTSEEVELIKALDRAESRPGWNFVPLRKFRDEILPNEHVASMLSDAQRRELLDTAINTRKLILTGRVTNPKAPQFPVTTIRLNRLMPAVAAALGQADGEHVDFRPITISGEPLSATVLRERR